MNPAKGALLGAALLCSFFATAPFAPARSAESAPPPGGPDSYVGRAEAILRQDGAVDTLEELEPLVGGSLEESATQPNPRKSWMEITDTDSEENLLIFTVKNNGNELSDSFLAYPDPANPDRYFLPLQDFTQMLEIPMATFAREGKAEGWSYDLKDKFLLDLPAGHVRIGKTETPIEPDTVLQKADGLYVRNDLIEKWFPVALSFDFSNLEITLTALQPMPIVARLAREGRRTNALDRASKSVRPDYPVLAPDYAYADVPFANVDLSYGYDHNKNSNNDPVRLNTAVSAQGTFAEHDMTFTYNDDIKNATPPNIRFKLSREDADGKLLGDIGATYYSFGDVVSDNRTVIARSASGRGATFTNLEQGRRGDSLTVTLRGELPPGSQVDLEANGQLLDFRREPDANGQYVFDNVPAFSGVNEYDLVFYSPQGQITRKTERVYADNGARDPGTLGYSIAILDRDRSLTTQREPTSEEANRVRMQSYFEYGLTKTMKAFGGYNSLVLDDVRQDYFNAGTHFSFEKLIANIQGIVSKSTKNEFATKIQNSEGQAISAQTETRVGKFNVQTEYDFFDGLRSEQANIYATLPENLRHFMDLKVNGPFKFFGQGFTLLGENVYLRDEEAHYYDEASARLSTFIKPFNISTEARHSFGSEIEPRSTINVQLASRVGEGSLRGQIEYGLSPVFLLQKMDLFGDYPLSERFGVRAGISRISNPDADTIYTLTNGITYRFDGYNLGFSVSGSDDGNYSAFMSLNFGIGYDPYQKKLFNQAEGFANSGAASAFAFVDNNQNGLFEADKDEPLEGARFKGDFPKYNRPDDDPRMATNANGFLGLVGIEPYEKNRLTLDRDSLPDPTMLPTVPGYYIAPRPGRFVQAAFPLLRTGEVDGTLMGTGQTGSDVAIPGIRINLKNSKFSFDTTSEFDGFVYFTDVPLGTYRLKFDNTQIRDMGYVPPRDITLKLTKEKAYVSFKTVTLMTPDLYRFVLNYDPSLAFMYAGGPQRNAEFMEMAFELFPGMF